MTHDVLCAPCSRQAQVPMALGALPEARARCSVCRAGWAQRPLRYTKEYLERWRDVEIVPDELDPHLTEFYDPDWPTPHPTNLVQDHHHP